MQVSQVRRCSRAGSLSVTILMCAGAWGISPAQQSAAPATPATSPAAPARAIPRPDELEPGVNTTPASSETPAAAAEPAAPESPAARAAPAAADTTAPAAAARKAAGGAKTAARDKPEKLELETTDITGNRELPKVLYIVPWKRSDLGDLAGKPVNSLVDEVLQPLDRDVFQRENRYYDALKPDQAAGQAGAAPAAESKP
jgi:hypothetical protein